jgi:hypothetical protein
MYVSRSNPGEGVTSTICSPAPAPAPPAPSSNSCSNQWNRFESCNRTIASKSAAAQDDITFERTTMVFMQQLTNRPQQSLKKGLVGRNSKRWNGATDSESRARTAGPDSVGLANSVAQFRISRPTAATNPTKGGPARLSCESESDRPGHRDGLPFQSPGPPGRHGR